jgi:alpha-L-fucosidase
MSDQMQGSGAPVAEYQRANTDWLAECRFGIGVHWTALVTPRHGAPVAFGDAVAAFDVDGFADAVTYAGADYVLFTSAHALQMLPSPHPVIDAILPGRTTERDLIGDLADALGARGLSLMVYYNHSCNQQDDAEWEKAVGYHDPCKDRLAENLTNIVTWLGERHGEKLRAWWFDSAYSLDPRGPHNSVTTEMGDYRFPWESFSAAAKAGHPDRLVTFNAGIGETYLYTTHQDYWAGEMVDIDRPAQCRYLDNGLQWFGWTCLEDRAWAHSTIDTEIPSPLYTDEALVAFVRACNARQAPMTFNVGIYQDGTMPDASVEQLRRVAAGRA